MDSLRQPLDEKVLYHECGEFYNRSSLHVLYGLDAALDFGPALFDVVRELPCAKCSRPMVNVHVCFPRSVIE